jgi:hypothetical protein
MLLRLQTRSPAAGIIAFRMKKRQKHLDSGRKAEKEKEQAEKVNNTTTPVGSGEGVAPTQGKKRAREATDTEENEPGTKRDRQTA